MSELIKKWEKFNKEFKGKCVLFLKELQTKIPEGVSLIFHTDPYEDGEEIDYFLNSRGIRSHGEIKYMPIEKFVHHYDMSHEMLVETLRSAQNEMNRYDIKVDWKKILA